MNKVHFSSEKDTWATPQELFDKINAHFNFTLDVCALPDSAKCAQYFTPEDDGLKQKWVGVCWMNPPYGRGIRAWLKKAYESNVPVVCLLPSRTDTKWWHEYCSRGEVTFLKGRIKFGGATTGAPFPSAIVVFNAPNPWGLYAKL